MQYFLCPRCQFKVPANKHLCQTCGYQVPSAATNSGASPASAFSASRAVKSTNPFAKLLRLQSDENKEPSQEKPALG
jgi:hypothetical protein